MADVEVKFIKNLKHECKIGDFTFIMDEPVSAGGDNEGPSPYDMMLAALGACTSMTIQMYARRKNWEIQDIKVNLTHEKIYAKDCETCETKTGRLDKITRNIEIKGDLSEEQKDRLLEIAEKCPVHKTLSSENLIVDNISLVN
ncbi:MAG: OsmC family protein [bacterium]